MIDDAENSLPPATQVLIAANPRAGMGNRKQLVEQLQRELAALGLAARVVSDADVLAAESQTLLQAGDLRAVVAAGGDGTFRLVAARTPPGTPLAILPLGTENLLARYLQLSADVPRLAEIIAAGTLMRFDAGRAGGQLFSLMAGCGFDADVVRRLHEVRSGNIHHLSYAKPILDSIRNYDYPELRIAYAPAVQGGRESIAASVQQDGQSSSPSTPDPFPDELTETITARWAFVVNLPRYAGGLNFAPLASGCDGLLDVCTFREGSLWHGLRYLSGVVLGQHETMAGFVHVQTRRLRIESDAAVSYQLDGDPGGQLPVEITIEPARLTLLVSAEWAEKYGAESTKSQITNLKQ
jgi:diacylglycerol kinase family enzyme